MKLFNLIFVTSVSGESIDEISEWQQPTYWEALEASNRRARWGHPIDIRAAAEWSQCPALEKPSGVQEIVCDGSTCMQVCEAGAISTGKRRTKCRWKRSQGFFWKRELTECHHCSLMEFNTCGWSPDDSASESGSGGAGTSVGGTEMRVGTFVTATTAGPPGAGATAIGVSPATATAQATATQAPFTTSHSGGNAGMICAAWSSKETVPEVISNGFEPTYSPSQDFNVYMTCELTARNKKKCTAKCGNGGKIIGKNKFVMSCKCPRFNGERQCGWYSKMPSAQLSSEFIQGLTCDTDTTLSPDNQGE